MEKVTQEIFKSGEKTFLTEKECLKYENRMNNDKLQKEIISFLISKGFEQKGKILTLTVFECKVHEFKFFDSDFYTYSLFPTNKHEHWVYKLNKQNQHIILTLSDINDFETFYNNILKIKTDEE